jgi:hypothetical protein
MGLDFCLKGLFHEMDWVLADINKQQIYTVYVHLVKGRG